MDLKERIADYKKVIEIQPQEAKKLETIQKAKEAFYASEQEKMLTYHEFLWEQFGLIRKRWWVMQLVLLTALWSILAFAQDNVYTQRCMGVAASLFIILIIPEFWRNQACGCMEIEISSYYSVRQIYSARMVLFGIVDIFFLTVFGGTASVILEYVLTELMVQFLFPMTVTACLCFGTLCSKHRIHEAAAVVLCMVWNAVWVLVILDEEIYMAVTSPIWAGLFAAALVSLVYMIGRTWNQCNKYYEVNFNGIEI